MNSSFEVDGESSKMNVQLARVPESSREAFWHRETCYIYSEYVHVFISLHQLSLLLIPPENDIHPWEEFNRKSTQNIYQTHYYVACMKYLCIIALLPWTFFISTFSPPCWWSWIVLWIWMENFSSAFSLLLMLLPPFRLISFVDWHSMEIWNIAGLRASTSMECEIFLSVFFSVCYAVPEAWNGSESARMRIGCKIFYVWMLFACKSMSYVYSDDDGPLKTCENIMRAVDRYVCMYVMSQKLIK